MREEPWSERNMAGSYLELDHPADLLLEIRGRNLPELLENALFALYDHLVDLQDVLPTDDRLLVISESDPPDALRRLLQEALVSFDTEGFLTASAEVLTGQDGRIRARIHGERLDPDRHTLLTEIKAITYHGLAAAEDSTGAWKATVLFDV